MFYYSIEFLQRTRRNTRTKLSLFHRRSYIYVDILQYRVHNERVTSLYVENNSRTVWICYLPYYLFQQFYMIYVVCDFVRITTCTYKLRR